jgi:hypothetical protein
MEATNRKRVGGTIAGGIGQAAARTVLRSGREVLTPTGRGPGSLTSVLARSATGNR